MQFVAWRSGYKWFIQRGMKRGRGRRLFILMDIDVMYNSCFTNKNSNRSISQWAFNKTDSFIRFREPITKINCEGHSCIVTPLEGIYFDMHWRAERTAEGNVDSRCWHKFGEFQLKQLCWHIYGQCAVFLQDNLHRYPKSTFVQMWKNQHMNQTWVTSFWLCFTHQYKSV